MFTWGVGLPHEPKIKEAYTMLKKQGIITVDPLLKNVQVNFHEWTILHNI